MSSCFKIIIINIAVSKETDNVKQIFRRMKRNPPNTLPLYHIPLRQKKQQLGKPLSKWTGETETDS